MCLKLPPGDGHDEEGVSLLPLLPVNVVYSWINFNGYPMGSSELDEEKNG